MTIKEGFSSADGSREVLSPQLQRKLDRHFLACSATVGASLAVVAGGSQEAKAAIIYSGAQNIAIPAHSFTGIYFDFDTGAHSTTPISGADANLFDAYVVDTTAKVAYHAVSFYGPANVHPAPSNAALATASDISGQTLKLAAGVTVGPASMVFGHQNDLANQFYDYNTLNGTKSGPATGQWLGGGTGFVGFRFVNAQGQTDYGWMRITLDPSAFANDVNSTIVIDWAYDNTGNAIVTGAIPEPSSLALGFLGAGAVGLAIWRQRRSQDRAAAKA